MLAQERHHRRSLVELRDASLRQMGLMLECRDLEVKGHTDRVVKLSDRFARHLGLDDEEREALRWGAYLHDVGKLALPDRVLLKPGPLDDGEMDLVREHPQLGVEMAQPLPYLPEAAHQVIRHHHERWDGRGYPHGLAGEDIPRLARVFGLVDVFDALCHKRPYKPAWPLPRVIREIEEEAGGAFDPSLAAAFLDMLEAPGSRT